MLIWSATKDQNKNYTLSIPLTKLLTSHHKLFILANLCITITQQEDRSIILHKLKKELFKAKVLILMNLRQFTQESITQLVNMLLTQFLNQFLILTIKAIQEISLVNHMISSMILLTLLSHTNQATIHTLTIKVHLIPNLINQQQIIATTPMQLRPTNQTTKSMLQSINT